MGPTIVTRKIISGKVLLGRVGHGIFGNKKVEKNTLGWEPVSDVNFSFNGMGLSYLRQGVFNTPLLHISQGVPVCFIYADYNFLYM